MKDRKLASRYARALLAAVREPEAREQTDAFLASLGRAFDASSDLRDVMLDPAVPRDSRRRVLRSIAESRHHTKAVLNFLDMLVDNNRVVALPAIAVVFHEELERAQGVVSAEMTTAAIEVLSHDPDGFWLMIESGDVDWANHANNLDNSIGATLAGDEAFLAVCQWAEQHSRWKDTAVILTADHGHYLVIEKPELLTGDR